MAFTEWMIRGSEISSCSCSYGCPCQFNSLPTNGYCRAAVGMEIEKGHYGKVKLDGLRWAFTAAWPGAIHMGHGEFQPIVDDKVREPMFKPIEFAADMKSCNGHVTVPGVLDVKTEAIRNPVTGNAHHARISLRQGFEFIEAEFASGTMKSKAPIALDTNGGHAHLCEVHLTGQGVAH
jgi:hypothetical protein